ncbi:MAG: hypothetical protein ABSH35_18210 [Isosphaeraceae bacterium]|jgi:hypothetical protein
MIIPVDIDNLQDANLFLRSLWAEFRRKCGKCALEYTPYKDGQKKTIFIGVADINRPEGTVEISVIYAQRGTIHSISFDHSKDQPVDLKSELGDLIQQSVKSAIEKMGKPDRHSCTVKVEGLYVPPRDYVGDSFSFEPISKRRFNLTMAVHAFDETDAKPEFVRKMRQVLNVLSVESNSAFWPLIAGQVEDDEPLAQPLDKYEIFAETPDWMDDCPVRDGRILISREGEKLIDMVAGGGPLSEDAGTFLRACNHFHVARKYAAQILDLVELGEAEQVGENDFVMPMSIRNRRLEAAGQMGDAHAEITGALYMSAMEVTAKIGQQKAEVCKECGQLRHKIAQRVTDLMKKCGGEHLARIAKGYYSQRSQYLHEGTMLSPSNYTGTSIPQLDPSSPTGCLMQTASPDPCLRDYVGFCLRKILKEVVAGVGGSG